MRRAMRIRRFLSMSTYALARLEAVTFFSAVMSCTCATSRERAQI